MDTLRVLVVDDNAALLRFLVSAFSANACTVTAASAAEHAIGLIREQTYDLVVSDIRMPGLTGLDLLRAVKGSQPATPVVLITGAPSVNSAVFGLRHGAYDYLPKPFTIKEIQELLERLRRDRRKWNGQASLPARLTEELARRQAGIEGLFRVGELALQGLPAPVFGGRVLDLLEQSLTCDGALLLLRDEAGRFTPSQHGEATVVASLLALLQRSFDAVVVTGGRGVVPLTAPGQRLDAIAAAIPGIGRSMGVVCLGRVATRGAFLPDEREMLLGYAQTTALALQKLLLRDNLERNLVDTITAFVNAMESKDPYLRGHSARVSLYATGIAETMNLGAETVQVVARGAMLHDLGKLSIMDTVLRKPARLTAEELAVVCMHPLIGDRILKPLRFLAREAGAVRHHHERFDGTGYPDRLRGEDIPLAARVAAVADVFDALTSARPYRTALALDAARDEIAAGRGTHFDPRVAEGFAAVPLDRLLEIHERYERLAGLEEAEPAPVVTP